jgi:orotidine-5'-phosphate decarboxylase
MKGFTDRLADAVRRVQNPVVVGIDPRYDQLPDELRRDDAAWADQADAYRRFSCGVIDAVAGRVPAVKPQMAFFEALGPPGMVALGDVIRHARQAGLLVILDGKRNDIGSTAEAYATAYLGEASPWQADALTVSPYLGDDSLAPFDQEARAQGAGLFVLVKTSNPGGRVLQDLQADGHTIYRHVAQLVERLAQESAGACGYGAMGAVVGATYPAQLEELRQAMPHSWFLVPGFGAQGGSAADVAAAFDPQGLGAVINSSRAIIFAHRRREFASAAAISWQRAVEEATDDMIAQLRSQTPAGRLT